MQLRTNMEGSPWLPLNSGILMAFAPRLANAKIIPIETNYNSKWKTIDAAPMTPESFLDMLEGRTPFLMEGNFLTKDLCHKLED